MQDCGAAGQVIAVRRFVEADTDRVVELFRVNSREHVADPAADGFVQGGLEAATVRSLAEQDGVWVVEADGTVVGFACAAMGIAGPPPAREIQRRADELSFHGRSLAAQSWLGYGPVVIDAGYRGRGLLRLLFDAIVTAWRGRAETGVAFVEEGNRRSMGAHVAGLGMTPIGRFDLDGRGYAVLAFSLAQPQPQPQPQPHPQPQPAPGTEPSSDR